MTEQIKAQVLVVGGGPGGYVAAIRCGQLGLDTVLVEGDRLGGTCLVRGCIPSKALIHVASEFGSVLRAQGAGHLGIQVTGTATIDLGEAVRWKDGVVDRLSAGVGALLKRAKVRVVNGWAVFSDAKTCRVEGVDGPPVTISAESVILAAGSEPVALPNFPWSETVISSSEALSLTAVPACVAVIGAGYIGLELGMALRRMGSEVTVVEAQDRILPHYDEALTAPVVKSLSRQGVTVHLQAAAESFDNGVLAARARDGSRIEVAADKVLVTVGRRPRTEGWGLQTMAVDMDGRFVKVDEQCRTSMRGVYAIGDLVGEPMLAHKASAQGEMVAELIAGRRRAFDPVAIPAVCFTRPEVVTVGDAAAGDEDVLTAVFPLSANGRALTMEGADDGGFVRVTARASDHRLLALAAVGEHVSELSGEMVALLEMGALLEDVAGMIHAHPTQSEGIHEASLRALGHAIHI
jgi:dihydrolipoamide dehydrogenase